MMLFETLKFELFRVSNIFFHQNFAFITALKRVLVSSQRTTQSIILLQIIHSYRKDTGKQLRQTVSSYAA